MRRQSRILAGTAIGLLMASAPLGAFPLPGKSFDQTLRVGQAPLILAQAECEGEDCPPKEEQQAPAAEEQQAPAEEPAAEPQPEPEAQPEPEPEPQPQAAPEPEPAPAEEAPAEQVPAAEEPAPEPEQAPQPEAQPEQAPAQPQTEEAPAEEQPVEPAPEQPAEEQPPAEQAPAEQPAEQAPAAEEPAPEPEQVPQEAPATEEPQSQEPQAEQPQAEQPQAEQPSGEQPVEPGEQPEGEQPAQQDEPAQSGAADPDVQPEDPNAAPILDSQKEAAPAQPGAEPGQQPDGQDQGQQAAQPAPVDQGPPPESDAAAQVAPIAPEKIQPVIAEEGQRIEAGDTREERERFRRERRERRDDAKVVQEFNDNRVIIQINNQIFIDSPDEGRIIRDRDDVYYEELPRGRVREVITRPNGVKIVTVRNRYGDIIRRSRIEPDNREVILVYVEDRYYDDLEEWRDPGLDLPPMRLTIPRRDYILESEYVEDPDDYYEFLGRPPVERVERTYSLNEVKRSARIRDKVRRIDMDTLTFEFGSASIAESEVDKLEGVAGAMEKLLAKNPAETFLLEGHTDAVGSDLANLALSDKRAEAVAEALTNVFGIPPENLATQGYGEQYLKVKTQKRERENRRVAIRRVTPLVAPVASAN